MTLRCQCCGKVSGSHFSFGRKQLIFLSLIVTYYNFINYVLSFLWPSLIDTIVTSKQISCQQHLLLLSYQRSKVCIPDFFSFLLYIKSFIFASQHLLFKQPEYKSDAFYDFFRQSAYKYCPTNIFQCQRNFQNEILITLAKNTAILVKVGPQNINWK